MCLTVSNRRPHLYVATQPMLVFKGLEKSWRDPTVYLTPYQGMRIEFGKMLSSPIVPREGWNNEVTIGRGLHSCTIKAKAYYHGSHTFVAIIPKGVYFAVGRDNDIVSTHLIVTKYMKASDLPHIKQYVDIKSGKVQRKRDHWTALRVGNQT